MKVLITGMKGSLESAVIEELRSEHQIYLVDTGRADTDLEVIECDIFDREAVQQAVKGMEAIIHLSEPAHDDTVGAEEREQRELDFATRGTYYLMQAAVSEGIQKFVYKSSLSLFDNCPESWVPTELWLPRLKAEAKPMAKYLGELVCREFSKESRINVVCLRLGKIVREEEMRGKPFDPMWVDARDAAQAFSMALKLTGGRQSRFNVFHISADNPDSRFTVSKAKHRLSYQPKYNFVLG